MEAKAKRLLNKFINVLGDDSVGKAYSKDCAIICNIQNRKLLSHLFTRGMLNQEDCNIMIDELVEIKQEIEKL